MKKLITLFITCLLGTIASWAEETRDSVYFNDFETASDWTAKGKTDGWTCNPGTTTANTFASNVIGVGAGTGDMGLVSPSFTIGNDVKIVDVELKFKMDACTGGKSSGIEFVTSDVNVNNGYVSSGTPFFAISASANGNGYWGTLTVGGTSYLTGLNETGTFENNSLNRNTTGIVTLNVRFNFTNKTATYSLTKGTTEVAKNVIVAFANANATTLDRIFLHAGKTYGGVTIDDVKVYSVVSDDVVTTYTATFTETNSLNPNVTIYSDADRSITVNNGALADGTTYYYTAELEGYHNYEGSFTVNGAAPTVEFTMTAKAVYSYTVDAVNGENGVIKTNIVSGTCYADETTSFYLPDCVLVDGTLYFRTHEDSHQSETVTSDNQVFTYDYTTSSVDNVVFFVEGENISGASTSTATKNQRLASNGYMGRGSDLTVTTLPAGAYTIYVHYINTNSSAHSVVVKAGETDVINNASVTVRPTINGSVILTESTAITLTAAGSSTSGVDYIYIVKTGEAITITASGYASYVTTNALDFSDVEGLTAYQAVNKDDEKVMLEKVTEVPAETPIIVKGTAGETYNIPVGTCSTELTGNILNGSSTTGYTVEDGETVYALRASTGKMHPVNAGVAIPAKKAYLKLSGVNNAKALTLCFAEDEEEATAITTATADTQEKAAKFFNAAGQQVSKNYNGMVIDENGNKYIK